MIAIVLNVKRTEIKQETGCNTDKEKDHDDKRAFVRFRRAACVAAYEAVVRLDQWPAFEDESLMVFS